MSDIHDENYVCPFCQIEVGAFVEPYQSESLYYVDGFHAIDARGQEVVLWALKALEPDEHYGVQAGELIFLYGPDISVVVPADNPITQQIIALQKQIAELQAPKFTVVDGGK